MSFISHIHNLKNNIIDCNNLSGLCYHYINKSLQICPTDLITKFNGAVEKVAAYGYLSLEIEKEELNLCLSQLENKRITRLISVYHLIGVCLQCKLVDNYQYQGILKTLFNNHSYRIKFLVSLIFEEYKNDLIKTIDNLDSGSKDDELDVLKSAYENRIWPFYSSQNDFDFRDDTITVLILEKYEYRKRFFYEIDKEKLLDLVMFCATEIQSKHKVLNNNEDQFNNLIQSLLSKDFIAESQSQRGTSSTGKSYGELDLSIYTKKENYPLGIIEAFILSKSIDKTVISKHLNKLSVSYDPNGLTRNYAIIYVKSDGIDSLWKRYLDYVSSYDYKLKLVDNMVHDISGNFPTISNIRIAIGNHLNGETPIELYHFFILVQ